MSLVQMAYVQFADGKRRPPGQEIPVEGGPGWVNSDFYTIEATAEGTPGLEIMSGPMMQALLEDRFKLKIRRGTQAVPVYELAGVAKGGPGCRSRNPESALLPTRVRRSLENPGRRRVARSTGSVLMVV